MKGILKDNSLQLYLRGGHAECFSRIKKEEEIMGTHFKCGQDTIVETVQGKLKGFYYDGIYAFHGVRYAKARRFCAPQPIAPWDGVKDALSYGYICPVLNQPKPAGEVATPHRFWPASEHCQYLNIWTGSLNRADKKPVLVWFHGGGFSSGSSIEQVCYEGDRLAQAGDVVVVTVNHRLNVFGFLDMSDFGEDYKNSANAGIADLVAALSWIKENIAAFGGNPDNVTIFGQSGGGGKVTALGQVERADGLFHKAVIMSGVLSQSMTASDVEPKALVLAILHELGLEEKDAKALETVPSQHLIEAVNRAEKKFLQEGKHIQWAPKANDWYKGDPMVVGFSKHSKTVPTMVGTVLGEFSLEPPVEDKDALTREERRRIVAKKYGEEHADEIIRLFKAAYPDKNEVYACYLDLTFRPDTIDYIKTKAAVSKAPVYSYMFSTVFDYDGGKLAWHCSDIPFWFHNAGKIPVCQIDGVTWRLEQQMSMALVNFARTGNPNTAGLAWWEPCNSEHMITMVFDEQCETRTDYEDELIPYAKKAAPPFRFDPSMFEDDEAEGKAWVY